MKGALATVLAAALAFPAAAHSADASGKASAGAAKRASSLAEGEVRRIDHEARKITIRHGPIANLDMPAMTMVFQVADPAMLDKVRPGDRVSFEADKVAGGYRVTRIVPAPPAR